MGILQAAGLGHLSLGHIELVLPQLPVGQGDDDAGRPVTCRSEQSNVLNAASATGVAAWRLHKTAGSLTISGGVVYLLAGLGESFRDISGRQTPPTVPIFNRDVPHPMQSLVHVGVSSWLHHPQLLQPRPDLVSARAFTWKNKATSRRDRTPQ